MGGSMVGRFVALLVADLVGSHVRIRRQTPAWSQELCRFYVGREPSSKVPLSRRTLGHSRRCYRRVPYGSR